MGSQVNNLCKNAFLQLRLIRRLRRCMNTSTCVRAVEALILSHIDYSVSFLVGITKKRWQRVQKIMNSAARVIMFTNNKSSVSSFIKLQGWLPVHLRIQMRQLCLMHSVLHNNKPQYLVNLLSEHIPVRHVLVPNHCTKVSERAFSISCPRLWNALPESVRKIHHRQSFCDTTS